MDSIKKKAYRDGFADGAFLSFIGLGCLFLYFSKKVLDWVNDEIRQINDVVDKEINQTNAMRAELNLLRILTNNDRDRDSDDDLVNLP